MAAAVLLVGLLVFLAHLFTALFQRTRVPDVLPLVFLGVLLGPVLGLIPPESVGKAGNVFTLVALGAILFESGLGLDFATLREAVAPGMRLTAANFTATMAAVGVVVYASGRVSLMEGLMLGAILGGTSSAVVIPMSQMLPLQERSRTILLLESTFSDVLCIVVTLALIEATRYNELRPGLMVGQIISSFTLASIIGVAGGLFWSTILEKVRQLENSIFTTPAFVLIIFGLSEILGYSGAISALTFGVTLGNVGVLQEQMPAIRKIASFRPKRLSQADRVLFAEVVFLLKTFFFVYIGLSIRLNSPLLVLGGLGLVLVIYALRVPIVRFSLSRATNRFDAAIACAMVPKGLAAAVLASLPLQAGIPHGAAIQDVTYAVILFSITATAMLSFLIEKRKLEGAAAYLLSRYSAPAGQPS